MCHSVWGQKLVKANLRTEVTCFSTDKNECSSTPTFYLCARSQKWLSDFSTNTQIKYTSVAVQRYLVKWLYFVEEYFEISKEILRNVYISTEDTSRWHRETAITPLTRSIFQEFPHFSCLGILIGFIAYTYKYTFQDVGTE